MIRVGKKQTKRVKSPLRYPGGKSRAVSQIINEYIPQGLPTLCSPFIGGGSIELALASRGTKVYGYDAFEPLVRFWQVLLKRASKVANASVSSSVEVVFCAAYSKF